MTGGAGDDLYVVDDVGDIVAESQGGGIDTVRASISYVLASDVENLVLTGSADLNGTGNNLANDMLGNDGDNTLDGKAGADVMRGGNGDDIYIVDDSNDVVTEGTDGGVDIVRANASFALSANVENLVLLGIGQFTGRGNDLRTRSLATPAATSSTAAAAPIFSSAATGGTAIKSITKATSSWKAPAAARIWSSHRVL